MESSFEEGETAKLSETDRLFNVLKEKHLNYPGIVVWLEKGEIEMLGKEVGIKPPYLAHARLGVLARQGRISKKKRGTQTIIALKEQKKEKTKRKTVEKKVKRVTKKNVIQEATLSQMAQKTEAEVNSLIKKRDQLKKNLERVENQIKAENEKFMKFAASKLGVADK